jgi:hypothetical protein
MIRVLHAKLPPNDIYIVPSFRKGDLERVEKENQHRSVFLPDGGSEAQPETANKFGGGLESVFMWVLSSCFKLGPQEAEDSLRGIVRREMICSSAYGRGFALPHTYNTYFSGVAICVIRFDGLAFDFNAIDLQPSHVFIVQLCSSTHRGAGLRAQEAITSGLRSLGSDADGEEIAAAIAEAFGIEQPYSALEL